MADCDATLEVLRHEWNHALHGVNIQSGGTGSGMGSTQNSDVVGEAQCNQLVGSLIF